MTIKAVIFDIGKSIKCVFIKEIKLIRHLKKVEFVLDRLWQVFIGLNSKTVCPETTSM